MYVVTNLTEILLNAAAIVVGSEKRVRVDAHAEVALVIAAFHYQDSVIMMRRA